MAATYKATGINLKGTPLGESDRLLTVLTREHGLVRVVAPGARKSNSKLGGRSALFVVNDLLISKGRSLDRIVQAETLESYPGLGQDLRKLTASQYLAELVLFQALSDHPQEELFCLLNEHFTRLDDAPPELAIACLTHAVYHFLATAGVPPQVHECCLTQRSLMLEQPNTLQGAGFNVVAGGTVHLDTLEPVEGATAFAGASGTRSPQFRSVTSPSSNLASRSLIKKGDLPRAATGTASYAPAPSIKPRGHLVTELSTLELAILQCLAQPVLVRADGRIHLDSTPQIPELLHPIPVSTWLKLEHVLRQYAEYQFDRSIRSACLIDTCFSTLS
ncbi:MAG: DNA repair protein RecO [Synechococcales cyanobacterium T60_A2020_003]|nr:DNA repair protein RecO [Synechococcales cyanobacterium T60_A2020_003]